MSQSDQDFIRRATRIGITGIVVVAVLFFVLWVLKSALTPLVISFILAYLLDPLIDRFEERGVPRAGAIVALLTIWGVVLLTALFFFIPSMHAELSSLTVNFPTYIEKLSGSLLPFFNETLGLAVPASLTEALESADAKASPLVIDAMQNFLRKALTFFTGTIGALLALLVIPVLAFYFLVEFDELKIRILKCAPLGYQDYIQERAINVDEIVSGFIRGQLIVCMILGILYAVGFSIIGIDLAIVIGLVSGLLAIIPYVGGGVAVTMASAMCLLQFGLDIHLVYVIGWYSLVQCLEGFVLTPKIVGESIGLHPVSVIISLMIGADLLGFLGMLIAVPVAAVIKVFLNELMAAYRNSSLYTGDSEDPSQTV